MPQIFPDRVYVERYVSGSWSDISSFVVSDLEGEYLIPSNDDSEKLAAVGELSFVVNNGDGSFSPNPNFQRGTPIRVRVVYDGTSRVRFLGTVLSLDPNTGEWGDQFTDVLAVDWLAFAVNYPLYVPEIQANMRVDEAVAYLLSLMKNQPESVEYHTGRETFATVFDSIKEETRAYSELNQLSLSEFAPIYIKAGNVLVVESANTRHGMRELSKVPVRYSDSHALLWNGTGSTNGVVALQENGFVIFADVRYEPRLSGTYTNVEIENGSALVNQVLVRAYPSRVDASPVLLFQLDHPIGLAPLFHHKIKGSWANPDGGGQINAQNIQPLVTGTNYQLFDDVINGVGANTEYTASGTITLEVGADGFIADVFHNSPEGAHLTKLNIFGYGIYRYNSVEFLASITGSVNSYGVSQMEINQKYQSDGVAAAIANSLLDREKEPRNELLSATFVPNNSIDLMQASQYMDIGDLVYVPNAKPALDTYAYIQGKKFVIALGGAMTETWYLKEMDSLRKGLSPFALDFSNKVGSQNSCIFDNSTQLNNLIQKTYMSWVYMKTPHVVSGSVLMSKATEFSGDVLWLNSIGSTGTLMYSGLFSSPGTWVSSGSVAGLQNQWIHVAVTMDASSAENDPKFYVNGVLKPTIETLMPSGTLVDDKNAFLIVGNIATRSRDFLGYDLKSVVKDLRVYNRALLSHEIAHIAGNPNNYFTIPDGLVLQSFCVFDENYSGMTGTVLNPTNKLIDNIYGLRGTPTWNTASGTSYALKGTDPALPNY